MKNYIIGTMAVIILVLFSIIYKSEISPPPRNRFPVLEEMKRVDSEAEVPLYLYVFFTERNCIDCLEIIGALNNLPPQFFVFGVVPEHELKDEKELRRLTGAAFPLMSASKYKKYIPWYTPAILGVSPGGDILFVLPGVPGEKKYLLDFLDSLYGKIYPIFLKKGILHKNKK